MNGQKHTFLALAGAVLLAAGAAAQQAKPAAPATPAAPAKLVAPVRGEAVLQYTKPTTKSEGNMIVTTIKVRNAASGAIAGLKVDEFWYDAKGEPVTGAQTFRYRKPLQPGEVIEVTLRVPRHPQMNRNSYKFEHANGAIKAQLVPKL